jgi:hypothetical protein
VTSTGRTTAPTASSPAPERESSHAPAAESDLPLVWVERWPDAGGDAPRHHLRSDYVETFWLPVLGPSSVLLLRLLAAGLAHAPGGYTLDLAEAARMLGIGHRGGRNGPMQRTIERCCAFGATRLDHGHQLLVRETLGSLGSRQLARLPESLRHRHAVALRETARQPTGVGVEVLRSRCRTLALSLLELGEGPEEAEVQLHRWRFHPAMAHESVAWAAERIAAERTAAERTATQRRADESGGPGVSEVA